MTHPRLTSVDGTQSAYLAEIGPLGAWGDLSWTTRFGDNACGMFEASWSMPLPADFDHPLLRRGTLVELMDGPWRVGSSLILNEPARGAGLSDPWRLVASGIGRAVEGEHSFYAFDGSGNTTMVPSVAVDTAIANGWQIDGRHASVPTFAIGASSTSDGLNTVGALLNITGELFGVRWGVTQSNIVSFLNDPTTPTYHVVPGTSALGVADDGYASRVVVRFLNSGTALLDTRTATNTAADTRYGHREFPVDLTTIGAITATDAQTYANEILARSKGRLGWTNSLPLTSNELLTSGGVPADLSIVSEQVGEGLMVRLHGLFDDLLDTTYLDVIIGEAKYADGSDVIDLAPMGMVAVDFAAVIEEVAGPAKRV